MFFESDIFYNLEAFTELNSALFLMDKSQLIKKLGELLPLDEESLQQILTNAQQLSTHSRISEYWLGLLGESPDALDFVTDFTTKNVKKQPTYNTKPPQRLSYTSSQIPKPQRIIPTNAWNQPTFQKSISNNKPRLSNNVNSTTSQLLDKPVEKKSKSSAKREKQKRVDNLKDLDAILTNLEIQNYDENSVCDCRATIHPLFEVAPNCLNCGKIICVKEGLRPCSFCGEELISDEEKAQIIMVLEAERANLQETNVHPFKEPAVTRKPKKITISSGAGVNLWKQQDKIFEKLEKDNEERAKLKEQKEKEEKEIEEQNLELQYYESQKDQDQDLIKAKRNLENLLNFQANGAERTKIIDQASDFELPTGSNLNIWSSGVEKALQLKKQQRQLRRQEKKEKELTGRGKRVVDITIGKDGKAILRETIDKRSSESSPYLVDHLSEDEEDEDQDIVKLEEDLKKKKEFKAEEDFKAVWDYEKDASKWESPRYTSENDEVFQENRDENDRLLNNMRDRVQNITGDSDIIEDLVVVI
ncbi:hypothetical protein WICMUC_001566 [Wickerhamomyces mucosus]|uniref:TRIP4/RQT4 C2HC5-type zinc finger domain-containing protein n=1 Tax=Wickerhamomyces mucosus TaxID=1378264 RepID=A0A9P8TG49_9ASCO|nr:hypothetical protein WICMUC_001566 [Wickerhamomyces mucosus]